MRSFSAATILLAFCIPSFGQETTKTFTYTKTKQADLEMVVHFPPGWKDTDKRPGIVLFFGGGWENGTIKAFEPQAEYLASRGMVAARADYRVKSRHGVTPRASLKAIGAPNLHFSSVNQAVFYRSGRTKGTG